MFKNNQNSSEMTSMHNYRNMSSKKTTMFVKPLSLLTNNSTKLLTQFIQVPSYCSLFIVPVSSIFLSYFWHYLSNTSLS